MTRSAMTISVGFLTERLILGYGVDLVVDQQALGLQELGFRVTVFAQRISELYKDQPYEKISIQDEFGIMDDLEGVEFERKALEQLAQQEIDVWVIHTPPFYQWKDKLPGACILWEHGTPTGAFHTDRKRGFQLEWSRRQRYRDIFNKLYPNQKLVTISQYIKQCLYEPARSEARVIYNGGDHYPLADADAAHRIRQRFGIAPNQIMLLAVSRIAFDYDDQPYKGIHELIEFFPELYRELPTGTRLVVVGRGDPKDAPLLERRQVIPYFNAPRSEMPALYKAADLFICPSRWEGFDLPLVEAEYQGTPSICLDVGAHPEVTGDPEQLARDLNELRQKIVALSYDPMKLKMIGVRANNAAQQFVWKKNCEALANEVMQLVNEPSQEPARPLDQRSSKHSWKSVDEWRLLLGYIQAQYGTKYLIKLTFQTMFQRLRIDKLFKKDR